MHKILPNIFIFLEHYNSKVFENNSTNIGIIYRNYHKKNDNKELIKISKACKKKGIMLFVSNNLKQAYKIKAEGLYIPSFNKLNNFNNIEKKIIIIGSAHNKREINQKILQNCKAIFLAPVFNVNKKKKFLDISKFNFLSNDKRANYIALGGINEKNIKKLNLLNISGFAGISLFKKKPAYKRPVFLKKKFF